MTRMGPWERLTIYTVTELGQWVAIDEYIDVTLLYVYANPGDGPQHYSGNRNNPPGSVYFTAWDMESTFGGEKARTGDPRFETMVVGFAYNSSSRLCVFALNPPQEFQR